ncbi:cytochrome c oxidase subunit 3 [Gracilibacillus caseinilyticus]|uniref:Cytochrome c oxidase subunit 3 n=1 Tax=Gracilibacillus caseinilyticus TaxID=2932256 RepID=A0ABY4ES81_9BACI|nr:cytochrome c oxidase subunit 3 [Gracilibacillus caseinilyticus]UOQ47089.1 cytochrome c oxidase subunit 3 [Gracilibacillus caseinilyticus]
MDCLYFNFISTIGAFLMGIGMLFFVWNIYKTYQSGKAVRADCWDGRTLEWTVPSPPTKELFDPPPVVPAIDPLWDSKINKKPLSQADQTRPSPVSTKTMITPVLAGMLFIFSLSMIYHWFYPAILTAAVTLAVIIILSCKDKRKQVYQEMSGEDNKELFQDKRIGFFLYLIIDITMFAILFATYFIYTPGSIGPKPEEVFETKTVILSSVFLLSSSATLHYSEVQYRKKQSGRFYIGWSLTALLGLAFLRVEIDEFHKYWTEGYQIDTNVFLASFYVLVGLHAAHVTFGLGWMMQLLTQWRQAKLPSRLYMEKQKIFGYYWHFVDSIWVFIVLIVYLPYLI